MREYEIQSNQARLNGSGVAYMDEPQRIPFLEMHQDRQGPQILPGGPAGMNAADMSSGMISPDPPGAPNDHGPSEKLITNPSRVSPISADAQEFTPSSKYGLNPHAPVFVPGSHDYGAPPHRPPMVPQHRPHHGHPIAYASHPPHGTYARVRPEMYPPPYASPYFMVQHPVHPHYQISPGAPHPSSLSAMHPGEVPDMAATGRSATLPISIASGRESGSAGHGAEQGVHSKSVTMSPSVMPADMPRPSMHHPAYPSGAAHARFYPHRPLEAGTRMRSYDSPSVGEESGEMNTPLMHPQSGPHSFTMPHHAHPTFPTHQLSAQGTYPCPGPMGPPPSMDGLQAPEEIYGSALVGCDGSSAAYPPHMGSPHLQPAHFERPMPHSYPRPANYCESHNIPMHNDTTMIQGHSGRGGGYGHHSGRGMAGRAPRPRKIPSGEGFTEPRTPSGSGGGPSRHAQQPKRRPYNRRGFDGGHVRGTRSGFAAADPSEYSHHPPTAPDDGTVPPLRVECGEPAIRFGNFEGPGSPSVESMTVVGPKKSHRRDPSGTVEQTPLVTCTGDPPLGEPAGPVNHSASTPTSHWNKRSFKDVAAETGALGLPLKEPSPSVSPHKLPTQPSDASSIIVDGSCVHASPEVMFHKVEKSQLSAAQGFTPIAAGSAPYMENVVVSRPSESRDRFDVPAERCVGSAADGHADRPRNSVSYADALKVRDSPTSRSRPARGGAGLKSKKLSNAARVPAQKPQTAPEIPEPENAVHVESGERFDQAASSETPKLELVADRDTLPIAEDSAAEVQAVEPLPETAKDVPTTVECAPSDHVAASPHSKTGQLDPTLVCDPNMGKRKKSFLEVAAGAETSTAVPQGAVIGGTASPNNSRASDDQADAGVLLKPALDKEIAQETTTCDIEADVQENLGIQDASHASSDMTIASPIAPETPTDHAKPEPPPEPSAVIDKLTESHSVQGAATVPSEALSTTTAPFSQPFRPSTASSSLSKRSHEPSVTISRLPRTAGCFTSTPSTSPAPKMPFVQAASPPTGTSENVYSTPGTVLEAEFSKRDTFSYSIRQLLTYRGLDACTKQPQGDFPSHVRLDYSGPSEMRRDQRGGGFGGRFFRGRDDHGGGRGKMRRSNESMTQMRPPFDREGDKRGDRERRDEAPENEFNWRSESRGAVIMESSEASWVVQQRKEKTQGSPSAVVIRKLRSLLNKLTNENFDKLYDQLLAGETGMSQYSELEQLVRLIFEKATSQHHYIPMYVEFCKRLGRDQDKLNLNSDGEVLELRRLMINVCQDVFFKTNQLPEFPEDIDGDERFERLLKFKHRVKGNVIFVGQLGNADMIAFKVINDLLALLLYEKMEHLLEAFCVLHNTVIESIMMRYPQKAKNLLRALKSKIADETVPLRVRCLLRDSFDFAQSRTFPQDMPRPAVGFAGKSGPSSPPGEMAMSGRGLQHAGTMPVIPADDGFSLVTKKKGAARNDSQGLSRMGSVGVMSSPPLRQTPQPRTHTSRPVAGMARPATRKSDLPSREGDSAAPKSASSVASNSLVLASLSPATAPFPTNPVKQSDPQMTADQIFEEIGKIKDELLSNPDLQEATTSVKELNIPSAEQPVIVRRILNTVLDMNAKNRPTGVRWLLKWAVMEAVSAEQYKQGVLDFVGSDYAELLVDLPDLPNIFKTEFFSGGKEEAPNVFTDDFWAAIEDRIASCD